MSAMSRALRLSSVAGVLSVCAGCQLPEREQARPELTPGMWVEAQGAQLTRDNLPLVDEVEQIKRKESDTADKFEVTAEVEAVTHNASVRLLGTDFVIDDESTEFEDSDRKPIEPELIQPGEVVKVKARQREGKISARTIRKAGDKRGFKLEGELVALDPVTQTGRIGSIDFELDRGADIDLLSDNSKDPLAIFLNDDQKGVPLSIDLGGGLRLGGQLSSSFEVENNFDLEDSRERDRRNFGLSSKVDLLWTDLDWGAYVFVEGQFDRNERRREGDGLTYDNNAILSRAFASVPVFESARILFGRQDFDEPREWLFDEVLDGVRIQSQIGPFDFDGAVAFGRDIFDENKATDGREIWLGQAAYHVDDEHALTGYVLRQSDSSVADFEPYHFGVRSYSRPRYGLAHWAEFSWALGHTATQDIRGNAIDVGFRYRFDTPLRPWVAAGFALGSGRASTDPETGFRQTGLQDNNAKFGGMTSFRYYGEVLDPELANLQVSTIDVGFRPVRNTSIDLVLHAFRQDVAASSSLLSSIRSDTNGVNRDLGWEADLVLGYRLRDRVSLEFVAGHFEPGSAFVRRDSAYKLQFEVRLGF